jgi:hypothetical protein
MINDLPQPQGIPLEQRFNQVLDIVANLIHQQKELASINRQLQWDLREAELRLRCIETWRADYRRKHPNE